jgi:hypothetical protein
MTGDLMKYNWRTHPHRAFLSGRVVDKSSGAPVRGAWVYVEDDAGVLSRSMTGKSGLFGQMNLPAGEWRLILMAPTRRLRPKVVFEQPIVLAPDEFKKIRLEFAVADFPDPPLTKLPVEVSGTFLNGFETSQFLPDDWKRCGLGSPDDRIWVELDEDDDAKFAESGTYHVRWRGVLEGPGRYGHLGASDYLLLVEGVFEATLVAKPRPPVRYPLPRGLAEHLKKFLEAWEDDKPENDEQA